MFFWPESYGYFSISFLLSIHFFGLRSIEALPLVAYIGLRAVGREVTWHHTIMANQIRIDIRKGRPTGCNKFILFLLAIDKPRLAVDYHP